MICLYNIALWHMSGLKMQTVQKNRHAAVCPTNT